MPEPSQNQVLTGDVADAWEALADSCRYLRGIDEEYLVLFIADTPQSLAINAEGEGWCGLLLPHLGTAVEKHRALGSMAWLSHKNHPDPMPPAMASVVGRMLEHYKKEVVQAADWACEAVRAVLTQDPVDEFASAIARHCASDIEEPARQWVLDVGLEEALRLLCLAGYQPTDEDLFTGMCSPREDGELPAVGIFVQNLSFTRNPLREHQVAGAWRKFVHKHTRTRSRWKDIADWYEKHEMLLHARAVLQAMAEGFMHDCTESPEADIDLDLLLQDAEAEIPGALLKLAQLAMKGELFEEAHFYWKRLQRHVISGPGSVDLDPAEIELHLMECRKKLGWFGSREEAEQTNGLLRENWNLRKTIADLEARLRSGQVRREVLGHVRSGALTQLNERMGDTWTRLCDEARDNFADAWAMMQLHAESRDCGFDLRKAVVMQTSWAVEAQLLATLFHAPTLIQLGWNRHEKPTLHDMLTEWLRPGANARFGNKAVRMVSDPQRLADPRLIECLRELSVQRNRAAHGYSQEQFETFRTRVLESKALADILRILVDFRRQS